MGKAKIIVRDRETLELLEDAKKGDIIDLTELNYVDTTLLEKAINDRKDFIYSKKLEEVKKVLLSEYQSTLLSEKEKMSSLFSKEKEELIKKINEQNIEINKIETNKENEIKGKVLEEKEKFDLLIAKLQSENDTLKEAIKKEVASSIEQTKLSLNYQFASEKNNLMNEIKSQQNTINSLKERQKDEIESLKTSLELSKLKEINNLKNEFLTQLENLKQENADLRRSKAALNVKNIGEDLEIWCDNEVKSYMQNGFLNCSWEKDNKVIKEEGDKKGSKADFIFKIYRNSNKIESQLLTSVCLEMKDENPDSINKKSNEDYYKALDNNRNKKNCEYALLVSNLESERSNDIPIYKVNEYQNMYVVRPAYLMVFLNMINSLVTRFANILNAEKEEEIELKNKELIMEEFNQIKETYLDKPLDSLNKQLDLISKSNANIRENSIKIENSLSAIRTSYLEQINLKLEKFEIRLEKIYKKNKNIV